MERLFPQQGIMMPDGLFCRPVPLLKADHYRALCSPRGKAVAYKMSCQEQEEGMQHPGHKSDLIYCICHVFRRLGRSVGSSKTLCFD